MHLFTSSTTGYPCRSLLRAFCAVCLLLATCVQAGAQETRTYADLLRQLTDLDRLTRLHPGYRAGLASSWDRAGRQVWGANGDAGQYLRVEENGEAVMMDTDGPGCIYRIWSANPQGKIRVYLDGDTKPTYEWDFARLFTGEIHPFIKPLVYQRDGAQSASDCYLPIPFRKHIKVTADTRRGQYYQFNYLLYPKDQPLPSFRLPLSPEEETALQAAADAWAHPERDPKPVLPDQKTITKTFSLRPRQTVRLADLAGPGIVRVIRARVASDQRYAWRKLVLRGTWDGAAWPQVLTPLGPFFGFDWETAEYASVVAGCVGGLAYFHYPMPFRRSGRLELVSHLEKPAQISIEIDWAPVKSLPPDTLTFYARWRHEPDSLTFDYPFVETAGQGNFVGVAMPIDHPLPGWWGEGDEKVWVDDDLFPPWIGTGSEDYFGDAWGIRYLPGPSFGASAMQDHRTCNYRWHFMDFVPFTRRFRMTIENYGPNGAGPRGQYDYTSTAFWYQAETTPPFEQLRGALYMGGEDPAQKPAIYEYHPALFGDLDDAALRTYGLAITFAREAEDLFADALRARRGKLVTDAQRPYEFNREQAVDFGKVKAGQVLGEGVLKADGRTALFPRLYTAPETGLAELTLEIEGKRLEIDGRPENGVMALSGVYLSAGEHPVKLVALGSGHALMDCLQMLPASRTEGAMEAEEQTVAQVTGGAPQPRPGPPTERASAGRSLLFEPAQAGGGMVVRFTPVPEQPYVLGVRAMRGPNAGVIQAFAEGRPLGPSFDLYAPQEGWSDVIYPLGPLPAKGEVEIRAVDKNPQSGGYRLALDYFRWEPQLIGPDSAEGVWARVLRVRGGGYSIQNLGPAWYGGHQLWIMPSSRDAAVEIALEIPREGDYELIARYTASWDYGVIQAVLDGSPIGAPVDCYAPEVRLKDPITLGKVHLAAGQHILQYRAVDKNPQSGGLGYLMGIDYVTVKAAR